VIIGIGIDAVEIERFRQALERTASLKERLFTAEELSYVKPQVDPTASLAARFAAREAVMKALGVGLGAFDFHDVSVCRASSGQPDLLVVGRARQLATDQGIERWHLSLTHTESIAMAYVIASGTPTNSLLAGE
jgi:holo-[acyl-carrier protein] synthase